LRDPRLARQQPSHLDPVAADVSSRRALDDARALLLLDPVRGDIGLGVAEPQVRPAELDQGEIGDAVRRLAHQAPTPERRIEPEAALVALDPVVGPKIDAADQLVVAAPQRDRPVALLAARHLLEALRHVHRRAVVGVRPGHLVVEIPYDRPLREAALDHRDVALAQRPQDQPLGLEHWGRRHPQVLGEGRCVGRGHVSSRFVSRTDGT
jgi:hypothetical protein